MNIYLDRGVEIIISKSIKIAIETHRKNRNLTRHISLPFIYYETVHNFFLYEYGIHKQIEQKKYNHQVPEIFKRHMDVYK